MGSSLFLRFYLGVSGSGGDVMTWQPIETAPMDGTKIDLWCKFEKSGWRRFTDAYWNDKIGHWQLGRYNAADYMVHVVVTHWMPLPAPPKQD